MGHWINSQASKLSECAVLLQLTKRKFNCEDLTQYRVYSYTVKTHKMFM